MSYQVLARKWRPKTFADVVGQQHILTALANGLRENRLHHAYLFSGTRGVGKTSIARLFAKGLNCINGVTAEPCGVCEHCKAIEEGNFIDLIEIDAASRTKVEDTRELLDNVQYKPVLGRYKVYLIDEVHMLSRHSFNALLKTLEEPPEYVKFLLATTDPHKLPVTILSRCMQFHLKALEQPQIADHLAYILNQEQIPFESLALDKLAGAAQGSIRDSLSLTDQAIAMSNGNVTLNIVNDMLGLLDESQAIEMIYALQQGNGEKLMQVVNAVADKAGDWDELLREVAENLHKIAMQQLLPQAALDERSQIGFLAKHIAPQDVQFFYQVVVTGRKELTAAPTARMGAEMVLLRALAFHPKLTGNLANAELNAEANPPSPQSAVENSIKSLLQSTAPAIEMPVVSQTIKANYQSRKKSVTDDAPTKMEKTESVQSTEALVNSPVLDALNGLDQLDAMPSTPSQEKKKSERLAQHSSEKLTALSHATAHSDTESAVENQSESDSDETDADVLLDEDYRWEWSNPELANIEQSPKPSEIKAAILQDITPELQQKIVNLTQTQDRWAQLIEQSGVENLTKEFALNTFIWQESEEEFKLGVRSSHSHLNQDKHRKLLQQALSSMLQKDIALTVEINDEEQYLTPTDYRRKAYAQLREQAKQDLLQDQKLQLLEREFDCQVDVKSIRPV
ncbi:DNA polymerase III subunit gamma/tau [Aggregatibacter actinomycetemcomitans]|uniref:DNA polymerase III subunit gamma/tau n=1 Tax=Aggregatibacter actinomycetemcomitans TaxID=714 RepID=UPI0011D4E7F6|nr:DNA polymerase III subunit gamma/tau [Aggregatibacter actinomycetemcomitans]TYB22276.1 DNA polymerase III subunit gamma/tau [Aggregatibacter actinomycetemcomitans]